MSEYCLKNKNIMHKILNFKKHTFFLLLALISLQGVGQPVYLEGNWSGSWQTGIALTNRGVTYATRVQASFTSSTTGFLFNNSAQNYTPKWCGSTANYSRSINTFYSGGAYHFNSNSGSHNLEFSATNGYYYTFIIGQNSGSNNDMSVLETTFNPTTITNVSQNPLVVHKNQVVTITVTVSNSTMNSGEHLFVRWTNDSWATSSFTSEVIISGNTGTTTIPGQNGGVTIQYYALTTNQGSPSTGTVDYYTLDLDNGVSNANYAYTTLTYLLPITLQSFTAQKIHTSSLLTWTSKLEVNADYFSVERSSNGVDFSGIGSVSAIGNSSIPNQYTFTDDQPATGINYYRLKMVDQDGKFEYSNIISLDFNVVQAGIRLFPNPGQDMVHLFTSQQPHSIMIFNSLGDLVKIISSEASSDGSYNIDTSDLPNGTYQVVASFDNGQKANTQWVLSR